MDSLNGDVCAGIYQGKLAISVCIMCLWRNQQSATPVNMKAVDRRPQISWEANMATLGALIILLIEFRCADICERLTEENQVVGWFLSND